MQCKYSEVHFVGQINETLCLISVSFMLFFHVLYVVFVILVKASSFSSTLVNTGGNPSREPSIYMELQPVAILTNREQVSTNLPNENTVSSQQTHQALIEYENIGFQTCPERKEDAGEDVYEELAA